MTVDRETDIRARAAEILAQQPTAAELEEMAARRERNRHDAIMARVMAPPMPSVSKPTRSTAASRAYVDRQVDLAFRAIADRLIPMIVAQGKAVDMLNTRVEISEGAIDSRLRAVEPARKPRVRVAALSRPA